MSCRCGYCQSERNGFKGDFDVTRRDKYTLTGMQDKREIEKRKERKQKDKPVSKKK